jgi:predicted nucleic acid-binding protein
MGSTIDLSVPGTMPPSLAVIDTNVIVARLLASYTGQDPHGPLRAARFFRSLIANDGIGIVTPTAFGEIVHVAIRVRYEQELNVQQSSLAAHYGQRSRYYWHHLYKIDPTILQRSGPVLEGLRRRFQANNLLILAHEDLAPITTGRSFDAEVIARVTRYGLDAGDSTILLEAERAGVVDVVTLDPDLRRAQADFNIYTWL